MASTVIQIRVMAWSWMTLRETSESGEDVVTVMTNHTVILLRGRGPRESQDVMRPNLTQWFGEPELLMECRR